MKSNNNYKIKGKKMTSRYGISHRQSRGMLKNSGMFVGKHYHGLSRRLMKKCTHPKMEDHSHGSPEGGSIHLHCNKCGYVYHNTLY